MEYTWFKFRVFFQRLKSPLCLIFTNSLGEKRRIHAFPGLLKKRKETQENFPGFELSWSDPFATTITVIPLAPWKFWTVRTCLSQQLSHRRILIYKTDFSETWSSSYFWYFYQNTQWNTFPKNLKRHKRLQIMLTLCHKHGDSSMLYFRQKDRKVVLEILNEWKISKLG